MPTTAFPLVNLNGTSKEELLRLNMAALEAARTAVTEAQQAWPNGRDFPGQVDVLDRARAEHRAVLLNLEGAVRHFETIVEVLVGVRPRT